jgi:fused signal recognition particle receptor
MVYAAKTGADAAGLVFDAIKGATEQGDDILLVDTAGRLHNKTDLMNELGKIIRVMKKADETAPHATILVLDATVGQNSVAQVKAFKECAALTGLILTKLDGTAKGGVLLALAKEFGLPVHAIGVGECAEDLHDFTAQQYADSLLGDS